MFKWYMDSKTFDFVYYRYGIFVEDAAPLLYVIFYVSTTGFFYQHEITPRKISYLQLI